MEKYCDMFELTEYSHKAAPLPTKAISKKDMALFEDMVSSLRKSGVATFRFCF